MSKKEQLSETILIRISPRMKASISKAAKARGEGSSALIRAAIEKAVPQKKK